MTGKTYTGVVLRSTGSWYSVLLDQGDVVDCRIKGKFRMQGIKSTNPVAVGDRVVVNLHASADVPAIIRIEPRENYIIRKATRLSKQTQIIAANIDQAVLVATLAYPRTSTGFIDRFLVTTEAYHIPTLIIFNKMDLYTEAVYQQHRGLVALYESVGYPCVGISVTTGENISLLAPLLKNKVTLFAGHSGVGKSALANAMDAGLQLKTGLISNAHNKGKHTTTFAQMYPIASGGYLIDTPGIKEFGLVDLEKNEISQRFPEMRALMHQCKFHNCTHVNEPGCAVKMAVAKNQIARSRYSNYLSILEDDYWNDIEY